MTLLERCCCDGRDGDSEGDLLGEEWRKKVGSKIQEGSAG